MHLLVKKSYLLVFSAFLLTAIVYWPGLHGSFVFDDHPNIVDNEAVQPKDASISSLVRAALSSPSSRLSRPLASLSFAINYLYSGLDPYAMKLTNLVIHLMNGLLLFMLSRALLQCAKTESGATTSDAAATKSTHIDTVAALITAGWLLLPINLTAVLYIVQRMESMANLFVLFGLIGYVTGRRLMLTSNSAVNVLPLSTHQRDISRDARSGRGFTICLLSITVPTAIGVLAKETAVELPLYALMVEWAMFHFQPSPILTAPRIENRTALSEESPKAYALKNGGTDRRIIIMFLFTLLVPLLIGLTWLLPKILAPQAWATRDFTLSTRLLSEARIIIDYISWTLLPTPHELSFYHDDFKVSSGLLTPWTTLACLILLVGLIIIAIWSRPRFPLVSLGIALFLGCHLLTGTILPLELIYEHRNYFASIGLLLAVAPLLLPDTANAAIARKNPLGEHQEPPLEIPATLPLLFRLRYALLACLLLCWTGLTAFTAYAWGNPLRLAEDLAYRAPESPRAQYELGRTYIIASHYDPNSPFTQLAYPSLERAAALPASSILPEQALIFMNARMHLPLKEAWWNSLVTKLKSRAATVQDESALASLTQCARDHECDLPVDRMNEAFKAALSHPNASARLLANYGDYAWNILNDKQLGLRMSEKAVAASPNEPAYHITVIRMLVVLGRFREAKEQLSQLNRLNYGGRLNASLTELHALPGLDDNKPHSTEDM